MSSPIWGIEAVELDSTGDLVADSLGARMLLMQAAVGGVAGHIPLFAGTIYYADAAQADDTGAGTSPATAKQTIGAALALTSAGDAVTVRAGAYAEAGLDLNLAGLELWCEIGVFINPPSGTALVLSGNSCRVRGPVWITAFGGQLGVSITGSYCNLHDVIVIGGTNGFDVPGAGNFLFNCRAGQQTAAGFDIRGQQGVYDGCNTVGIGASRGFYVNGGADTGVLLDCTSTGHQTASFTLATGSQDWTLLGCSSGAGDGRWVDVDRANVWSRFSYANRTYKAITLVGGTSTFNLFQITGAVRVSDIHGHVDTVIPNVASDIYLQLFSTNGTVDITDAPGVDIDSAVEGALLVRNGPSTDELDLADPDSTPAMAENVAWKDPKTAVDLVKDDSADTYIRLVMSAPQASGAIHWHCDWEPLSDDGFLEAV